ncbi:PREDICTED: elicitor peptide 6 [Nelumbo nucifera]|nr:PREDICTED: elicitor peptide 6 [Nelumbo nucifera]
MEKFSSARVVAQSAIVAYYSYSHQRPCCYLQQALRAISKCVGLDSSSKPPPQPHKEANKACQTGSQDPPSATDRGLDPPSTTEQGTKATEDAAATPQTIETSALTRRSARPPPVNRGSGGQTN